MSVLDKISRRYESISEGPLEVRRNRYFRVNTIKCSVEKVVERFSVYGFRIENVLYEKAFTCDGEASKTLEHFMGHIYIQDMSSMLPVAAVRDDIGDIVLDACAAPGSKTTQIADEMKNSGNLVANDASFSRLKSLKGNLERCGVMNCIVISRNIMNLEPGMMFDTIFLDAPCSGEGISGAGWSEKKIISCSRLQKNMIVKCFDMLKKGGTIVYSTCTYAPEENEQVMQHLIDHRECNIEKPRLDGLKFSPGILEWRGRKFSGDMEKCTRLWPSQNNTHGFFLSVVKKP